MAQKSIDVDPRSGFCRQGSVFYSKRRSVPLPSDEYLDIATFISTRQHSGTVALIDASSGRHVTFRELWRSVDSLADFLSRIGVQKGHVILILSPNSIYFPVVCLSVMSLGAIITTCNPLNTPREIAKQIADSNPVLAFAIPPLVSKIADSDLPVVLLGESSAAAAAAADVPAKVRVVGCIEELIRSPAETSRRRAKERVRQDDTASLLYSSGTTGVSKGVVSSHRNMIAMVQTIMNRFDGHQTFVCTVPMFHVYGLSAFAMGLLGLGSTIIILSKFDIDDMMAAIARYKATYLPLVPPILMAMINGAEKLKKKYDLSSLGWVLSGGAPLSKEVIEGFLEKYEWVKIMQGYGLTETTGIGASTDSLEESRRYGTAGLLSPNMEAMIVDPDNGEPLSVNRTGELWLRGPSVMKGYFSNPEATTSTLNSEGWLRTGDVCYFDEDGFIFVVDRLKELIKYKGYQVAPAELEALLLTHPQIVDAAVIPYPDKEVGQYPMAYVVRNAGSNLSDIQVMDYIAKQVAPYKRIRRVAFVEGIPKNPSGKILRKDLIKLATSKL